MLRIPVLGYPKHPSTQAPTYPPEKRSYAYLSIIGHVLMCIFKTRSLDISYRRVCAMLRIPVLGYPRYPRTRQKSSPMHICPSPSDIYQVLMCMFKTRSLDKSYRRVCAMLRIPVLGYPRHPRYPRYPRYPSTQVPPGENLSIFLSIMDSVPMCI